MTRLKIYIAGPYTGATPEQIEANVEHAIAVGIEVMKLGHFPLIPHLTHYIALHPNSPWDKIDRRWIAFDSAWFSACDAILITSVVRPDTKEEARGVVTELIEFARMGKIVFRRLDDIPLAKEGPIVAIDKSIAAKVLGVSPDAEIVTNPEGGKQSKVNYRLDLVDAKAFLELGRILAYGATRYAPNNWRKISEQDHLNHALIHIYADMAGDETDAHLSHAFCRVMMALAQRLATGKRPEYDKSLAAKTTDDLPEKADVVVRILAELKQLYEFMEMVKAELAAMPDNADPYVKIATRKQWLSALRAATDKEAILLARGTRSGAKQGDMFKQAEARIRQLREKMKV